ncbi:MAG: hypothetical protein COV10_04800 [Candidatus Vogelbacteria bacterium CG10_big_fil_rev_8_21_14_0_10_51_16]|uniref:Hydrolase TatD n=1 Tax=Candidatus Vogelbacteria bacterium CG10_big_fil_rev_8_21_14_0_10_51_16 TaxID=1975045 RepID=A0A2H0RD39_9BACT|nr:MAG: hypothetical protein COV10_04800 [Candidatus Vogelbacteria bacterium CG10_big_fil_rev_8_21_14_0_10_51_16]
MPKFIDIHTHSQFVAFDEDREVVMRRAEEAEVGQIVVGTQKDTSQAAVALANAYSDTWATIGLHPIHTACSHHDTAELGGGEAAKAFASRGEVFDYAYYKALALDPKVVGIGECGLDYYRQTTISADNRTRIGMDSAWREERERQMEAFEAQIALANEVGKPLMLHIRDGKTSKESTGEAYRDALATLKRTAKVAGNVHFFAGTTEIAKQFLDLGFTISFTGVITFTHDYDEVIRFIPLDMLQAETDSPYVAPMPHRGKRNEPAYVTEIVKRIAEIKGLHLEESRLALLHNARRVWRLP